MRRPVQHTGYPLSMQVPHRAKLAISARHEDRKRCPATPPCATSAIPHSSPLPNELQPSKRPDARPSVELTASTCGAMPWDVGILGQLETESARDRVKLARLRDRALNPGRRF